MSSLSDSEQKAHSASEKPAPGKRLRDLLSAMQEDEQPSQIEEPSPFANEEESRSDKAELNDIPNLPNRNQEVSNSLDSTNEKGEASFSDKPSQHPTGYPEQTGGWFGQGEEATEPIATPYNVVTLPIPGGPAVSTTPVQHASHDRSEEVTYTSDGAEMPDHALPRRVEESDRYATRVTPSAYTKPAVQPGLSVSPTAAPEPRTSQERVSGFAKYQSAPQVQRRNAGSSSGWSTAWGCLLRIVVGLMFLGILMVVFVLSIAIYQYYSIAKTLPDISDLQERASQFETTRILDRNGGLLYEILDPTAGRRTYVPLEKISPYLIAATIATEDKEFYNHPGFDPIAILRAFWQNYTNQEIVSGASTITQQLARTLLLTPEERSQKTYERKAREIVLAAEITRRYTKDEILELYLNEVYYGNLAYGIEAAAETYFNTTADKLTLAQASFLAGLPQAPAVYDIFSNREETLQRQKQVLVLMYELSQAENCIEVSIQPQKICVDA